MPVNWFAKLKSIKMSWVVILIQGFLIVNAPLFVKSGEVQSYRFLLMTYAILLVSAETFIQGSVFGTEPFSEALLFFAIGLTGTSILLTGGEFIGKLQTLQLARNAPLVILLTQATTVAFVEEKLFRDKLVSALGLIPAQISFGLFHFVAYQGAWMSMLIAVIAGFIFFGLDKVTNSLYTSIGAHVAYNCWTLGLLSILGGA